MKICDVMSANTIIPSIKGNNKLDVISELIDTLKGDKRISDINKVKSEVMKRESIMSTNLGNAFAIPHAKTDAVEGVVIVFGKSSDPIQYDNNKDKVQYFFLVLSNSVFVAQHIKLLCQLSVISSTDWFRDKLAACTDGKEIYELFMDSSLSNIKFAA